MNYLILKIILWLLLGLPLLTVCFYILIHTIKEVKRAMKANDINE